MPHYVNIAWGFIFWRVFLFVGRDGSLDFAFYLKNQFNIKKLNTMCRMCAGTKSMTKNKTEGLACGRALKTGRVWQNTFKIISTYFAKRQGLKPCGVGRIVGYFFYSAI
jgi:hypothetical protein